MVLRYHYDQTTIVRGSFAIGAAPYSGAATGQGYKYESPSGMVK